jgi:hypothetical protein
VQTKQRMTEGILTMLIDGIVQFPTRPVFYKLI